MINGILLLNKPKDWTSQDCVSKCRHIFNTKQIGHTGTLDPMATGVLIILLGNATKLSDYFLCGSKEYITDIIFGIDTNTYDITGEILKEENTLNLTKKDLENVISDFIGNIEQVPPMVSAKKINGVPLYKLARQGKEIDRKPCEINIAKINILDTYYKENHFCARIKVECSHGTYIRALGRDLGLKLNTFATLFTLERTQNFDFNINQCITMDELVESEDPINYLLDLNILKKYFSYIDFNENIKDDLSYGKFLEFNNLNEIKNSPIVTGFINNELVSIGKIEDNLFKPKKVFIRNLDGNR